MNKRWFADVILPLALPKLYTFGVPDAMVKDARIGVRGIVQFGKKKVYSAIIHKLHNNKPEAYETKDIQRIIDHSPIVSELQLEFWQWIANYYSCSLGEVMKAALPAGLKLNSETKVIFNPAFTDHESLLDEEFSIIEILENNTILPVEELSKIAGKKNILPVLKNLSVKKALFFEERVMDRYVPKKIKYIVLNENQASEKALNQTMDQLQKAPKQLNLLMTYLTMSGFFKDIKSEVKKSELLQKCDATTNNLQPLIQKGILIENEKEESRVYTEKSEKHNRFKLTDHQEEALQKVHSGFLSDKVVLLHGITSSGKTEIYIHLINEVIQKNKAVLYLVPEIALTAQIIEKLTFHFGNQVGIYHSKYSDAERFEIWNDLLQGEDSRFKIILGVRSSIFLPFKNLGLIIIDEEHENTYKQFDPAPRYHARDSAIILAGFHKANVLLGTATPAIETYFNAQTEKYALVELRQRHKNIQLPNIEVVDTTLARKKKIMHSHFSKYLIDAMEGALNKKEQVILFQNRRGYSPFIECQTCGWVPYCINCDVSLTYHKYHNQLVCHYCGYSIKNTPKCLACESHTINTKGFGTEKVEDEIKLLLPEAKVARLDLDTTRTRKSYETIIEQFEKGVTNILVGTQMLSKGMNFKNVSLVGIINADNMLNYPDFRAHERSFQLMEQVSGRAGRFEKQGQVIIQTADPKNPIIQHVVNHNYTGFYNALIKERYQFKYPPYYRLIKIVLKHRDLNTVTDAADSLAKSLHQIKEVIVMGPESPIIGKVYKSFIKHIYLKVPRTKSHIAIKQNVINCIGHLAQSEKFKAVQIYPDIDPA